MIKVIFKIIGWIIGILCLLFALYFLFAANGIEIMKSLFSGGFWQGIKDFFVGMWDGFKALVGLS